MVHCHLGQHAGSHDDLGNGDVTFLGLVLQTLADRKSLRSQSSLAETIRFAGAPVFLVASDRGWSLSGCGLVALTLVSGNDDDCPRERGALWSAGMVVWLIEGRGSLVADESKLFGLQLSIGGVLVSGEGWGRKALPQRRDPGMSSITDRGHKHRIASGVAGQVFL